MQERIAITPFVDRLPGLPGERDRIGDLGARRRQFRREIFGNFVVTPVEPETDAASAHHVEKQRALGGASIPPCRDREIVRPETAAVALDQRVGGAGARTPRRSPPTPSPDRARSAPASDPDGGTRFRCGGDIAAGVRARSSRLSAGRARRIRRSSSCDAGAWRSDASGPAREAPRSPPSRAPRRREFWERLRGPARIRRPRPAPRAKSPRRAGSPR